MSNAFIKAENQSRNLLGAFHLNLRLFRSLPLFRKLFPLSVVLIVLSSAAPSVVRWYSGKFASGEISFSIAALFGLVFLATFFRITAWMSFEMSGMWSSQKVHAQMVHALSHTRTTYFDENPSGRLINRLIVDYDEVRFTAIVFAGDLFNAIIEIFSIAVVGMFANPWVMAMVFPLLFTFFYIHHFRSLMLSHARRLSAVATSHVLARQTDIIEGREVFMLYGKSERLLEQMAKSMRNYAKASLLMAHIDAWGSFWIRSTAELFSFFVLIFLIFAMANHHVDQTWAGVIISSLFGITGSIGWLDFATSLISRSVPHLERVYEIVDLPAEETEERSAPKFGTSKRSSLSLNAASDLQLKNYSMSYRKDSPLIFRNLNLTFKTGQKTALIGRTGSGKSSLIQSLFRMVHVQEGDIVMHGDSVFNVPIREYRKRFAMIPQSPYLFEGTLHSNLDPLQERTSSQLQASLDAVGLNFSLGHRIVEEGKNLSQGERQLVCLARAIAADKSFLILDEATSGLDPETDARILQVLKKEFKNKTVITIAHRLDTIRDHDWVIELAQGQLVRQGKPMDFL
jgi:ATP-binding cassette subfamily C (CFTR/MRP) protein 1